MSLLHPTCSDIWDRIVILQMKIDKAAGVATDHWKAELQELLEEANKHKQPIVRSIDLLREVNGKIWDGIDTMLSVGARTMSSAGSKLTLMGVSDEECRQLAALGVDLQRWNSQRVVIKEAIDKRAGEFQGPEKL